MLLGYLGAFFAVLGTQAYVYRKPRFVNRLVLAFMIIYNSFIVTLIAQVASYDWKSLMMGMSVVVFYPSFYLMILHWLNITREKSTLKS
ncbi:hypothetical protein [Photobacterium galatheae]|uniref:Uncharacterized protein n=1 Tax=Photobacterium galatheae TaxID=1654360 RepID=A0A066RKV2_9GAMM|nr:hypothetical protein [Photobacterium galatheae]KDM89711.1 hypothetical protein EA58_21125 [Photobacterium galatheae]